MTLNGYTLITEWKNSTSGQIARATKGGKTYFLKKYQTPVAPLNNGALDAKTFAHNKKQFEAFVDTRKRINKAIRSVAGPGGNIIIPSAEFIEGNQLVEASEFVEGVLDGDEMEGVLASLSTDVKKLLMQTAAGALFSVHKLGIIHSDLKLKNVLLVRNETGNYVAKLVDFDSSYFVDEKPDEVIGTIDYYSPELGAYSDAEDDREELGKRLTDKSDIFSLGLIFHYYLCGSLPKPVSLTERLLKRQKKGKVIYCWVALNSGCELEISPDIKSPKFISLLRDMLSKNPDDRPAASDVLKRLKEDEPIIEEPWPEHSIILDKGKLSSDCIVGLKKKISYGKQKYELLYNDGSKEVIDREEMLKRSYAKGTAPAGFGKPWGEHNIEFNIDRIRSRGFVSGEQATLAGIKGYNLYRADSKSTFFKLETLLAMNYAIKKSGTSGTSGKASSGSKGETGTVFDTPWPEHDIILDVDAIKSRGFVGVKKDTLSGIKGYRFTKSSGISQFMRVEMVINQKMARKK